MSKEERQRILVEIKRAHCFKNITKKNKKNEKLRNTFISIDILKQHACMIQFHVIFFL